MSKYVLKWQKGLYVEDKKFNYTYGHINTLREKAKMLAEDDKIVYITIDKVEEVIKDTRVEEFIKQMDEGCKHENTYAIWDNEGSKEVCAECGCVL